MIAALFLSHVFGGPALQQLRWATFAALGLAPLAFLVGLLHDRLARSSVGDLLRRAAQPILHRASSGTAWRAHSAIRR